jgi:eukaryotic-like serine/threonine-protein kinase
MTLDNVPVVGSKYALITKLGHGSMADVYLGLSEGMEGFAKLAVVKLLRSHLAQDKDFVERFLEEGRIAMRLSHPNVIQTYEVGQDGSSYFLAMEYLEGQTLSAILNRLGRRSSIFDFACQVAILIDVLGALEYAHELADYDGTPLDVIHRDISPPNIMITYDGTVKVVDFGIAKCLDSCVDTKTGLILGKAAYMAPEQALGRELDRRTDLYAVGVMLWEAAAGRRRWEGIQDAAIVRELVTNELVELPADLTPGCPEMVHDLLARALAPDARDRYATASEFRNDLERLFTHTGSSITSRRLGPRIASAFRAERESVQRRIELHTSRRSNDSGGVSRPPRDLKHAETLPSLETAEERGRPASITPMTTGARQIVTRANETRRQSLLAAGAVALAIVAAWSAGWLVSTRSPEQAAATESKVQARAPEKVSLRLAAYPPASVLYLDESRLAGNPSVVEQLADGSVHIFRAEAPGHESEFRVLRVTGHIDVTLRLRPLPASEPELAPAQANIAGERPRPAPKRRLPSPTEASPGVPVGRAVFPPASTAGPPTSSETKSDPNPKVKLDTGSPW